MLFIAFSLLLVLYILQEGILDMCLCDTDASSGNKVKIWQKSLSPTF